LYQSWYRLSPEDASAESFVPGTLISYNETEDAHRWQHDQMMWHAWNERTGWRLYIVQNHPGNQKINSDAEAATTAPPMSPRLRFALLYPGQRYEIQLNRPPEFLVEDEAFGTVAYEIGVSAVAAQWADTPESAMSIPAAVVVVDRCRPPPNVPWLNDGHMRQWLAIGSPSCKTSQGRQSTYAPCSCQNG
jgi:hypothetical protein